jgi:hypothetical protein
MIHPFKLRRNAIAYAVLGGMAVWIAGCATPETAPTPTPPPSQPTVAVPAPQPPPAPPPAPAEPPPPLPIEMPIPSKETSQIDLPAYARKGRRLPADGGDPGRTVMAYCRSFEIERDAQSYFKRLERQKQLPSADEITARSREAGQTLTVQQVVERDWAIRRDNAKSSPQRCKVLGGSVDAGVAVIVLEADINGRRQRGSATVVPVKGKWRVRDHGDWSPIK